MRMRLVQLSVGLATSAMLLALLLHKTDAAAVTQAVGAADTRFIIAAVALYLFAMCLRALVWRRLFAAHISPAVLLQVLIAGFAVSFVMPLRVGEAARAYLLKRWSGIDYGTTLATIVAERVLDGLAVGCIMLVAVLFVPVPGYLLGLCGVIAVMFAFLTAGLLIASQRSNGVVTVTSAVARRLPARVGALVERQAGSFAYGLEPLRNLRALPVLVALTTAGWLSQFAVFYLVMLAFPMTASIPVALVSGGVTNFATLLPSAPGFVGTFDAALVMVLTDLQSVGVEVATAYALVVHTIIVVPIVVLGAIVLWRANLSLAHVMARTIRSARVAAAAAAMNALVLHP